MANNKNQILDSQDIKKEMLSFKNERENKQKTRSLLKDLFSVSIDLYSAQNIQSTPLQAVGAVEKVVEEFKECVVIVDELDRCRPDFALEIRGICKI